MWSYLIRRILYLLPTILGVNLLVFLLFFAVNSPDHMAQQALGEKASTPEQILRWKEARGYHLPLIYNRGERGIRKMTRTLFWTKSLTLLKLNFGKSDMNGVPIGPEIRRRILPSLCLMIPVFLGSLLVNLTLAMSSAVNRGKFWDSALQCACVVAMSTSSLISIIVCQFLFGAYLKLVPVSGFLPGADMVRFLALPICIAILAGIGSDVRFYRTIFLEELSKDYVRTARAKGLSDFRIYFLHVLKNALIPILTSVPTQLLMLIMGSVLLENFFSIPGMGGYTIQAIHSQDFSIVRAMVFLGALLYMLGMLLTDLCYAWMDPRIRLQSTP